MILALILSRSMCTEKSPLNISRLTAGESCPQVGSEIIGGPSIPNTYDHKSSNYRAYFNIKDKALTMIRSNFCPFFSLYQN